MAVELLTDVTYQQTERVILDQPKPHGTRHAALSPAPTRLLPLPVCIIRHAMTGLSVNGAPSEMDRKNLFRMFPTLSDNR